MSLQEFFTSIGIGALTGFLSGLMGIGGSAFGTPLMRLLLGVPAVIALATPMPVMFPSAIAGVTQYVRQKKVDWKLAGMLLVVAMPLTWIGAQLTAYIDGRTLMLLTAVFLIVIGSSFLARQIWFKEEPKDEREPEALPEHAIWKIVVVGAIGGLLAGLLAIGGGVIYVPAILRVFKRSMKVALATSLIVVTAVSIPGTIKHSMLGHIDWTVAGLVSIGVIPFAIVGARLALRLRNQTLERIFGVMTIVFGIYFLISQW